MNRWFGPKYIGFGVGPRSWQGWLATLVFAMGAVAIARWFPSDGGRIHYSKSVALVAWLALYFAIVAATYGKDATSREE